MPQKDWDTFSMERFDGLREMPTAEIGRLMIEPGHRGQLGLVSMSCAVYQMCAGELAADAAFINCAAGLVRHYRLLGFRTYAGRLVPTADGIEVPLVLIPVTGLTWSRSARSWRRSWTSSTAQVSARWWTSAAGPACWTPTRRQSGSTLQPSGNVSPACGGRRPTPVDARGAQRGHGP